MLNYYLYDQRDGLCHPFPFASYASAERHNRTLGGNYRVQAYRVTVFSEDDTEELAENAAFEAMMAAEDSKYQQEWGS